MKKLLYIILFAPLLITSCSKINSQKGYKNNLDSFTINKNDEVATLAGGCFWCIEAPFEKIEGVSEVISGYAGGTKKNPTYNEVSSGVTKYREAVQVYFNPAVISYSEILDIYWKQFDPTDEGGSFYDRGLQYTSAIFVHDKRQKNIAEDSKKALNNSGIFNMSVVTPIIDFTTFYNAEDYHQDYYKKDPDRYFSYREGSGRDKFIQKHWKDEKEYSILSDEKIKKKLTDLQFRVTQHNGTERAFSNKYWDNKEKGIYVDVVSGEPVFSSKDKFKSGTGWPSFIKPIDPKFINKVEDNSYGMTRVEVRSSIGDSHLGHLFYDGPEPTNLRYCINSASLQFIPKDKMKEKGYSKYLWLVD